MEIKTESLDSFDSEDFYDEVMEFKTATDF